MATGQQRGRYLAGTALLAGVAAFILLVFALMSTTDLVEEWLAPTAEYDPGWQWEVLEDGRVTAAQAEFRDEYTSYLPSTGADAVRGRLTLPDAYPYAMLHIASWGCGTELFLDGELLYSDFDAGTRGADGFWQPDAAQRAVLAENDRQTTVYLPDDYAGKELTLIRYYPAPQPDPLLECPVLRSDETAYAVMVTSTVPTVLLAGLWALAALLVAAVFVMDLPNGSPDWRSLLLMLYFLMLFVYDANRSAPGSVSFLRRYLDLTFVSSLYGVPLLLYLALRLSGWRRWFLCAVTVMWAGAEGWQMYRCVQAGDVYMRLANSGQYAFWLMLVYMAVFLSEAVRRRPDRKNIQIGVLWLGLAAVRILYGSQEFDGDLPMYLYHFTLAGRADGNSMPLLNAVTDATAAAATILLVSGVVRRTVRARRTVEVLRERSRQTLAGYERMLRAEEATNAANHEMRHHMTALAGLLQQGDVKRAREYIAAVADTLDRLPEMRYSANILVNAVAGAYLDEARAQGIRVEYNFKIPAELAIADEDLSVFLTNMLENALHACQQTAPGRERFIRVKMALHENFLLIGCVNTAPDEQEAKVLSAEQRAARRHGYGLEAMRQIAEKYGSILLMEQKDGTFSVKSNFTLKPALKA